MIELISVPINRKPIIYRLHNLWIIFIFLVLSNHTKKRILSSRFFSINPDLSILSNLISTIIVKRINVSTLISSKTRVQSDGQILRDGIKWLQYNLPPQ